jgi:hypothetical protein
MKKYIVTGWMIFLWVLIFPVPIFTRYSNCWYWSLWQKITKGGHMIPYASKRWSGHHWVWKDNNGETWEYTTIRKLPKFSPWWTLVVYKGYSRKFRTINK